MDKVHDEDAEHDACADEGGFGLKAVVDVVRVVGDGARLGDVPRGSGLWVLRIAHVAATLVIDGDGEECDQEGVGEYVDERWEDVQDVHDGFAEEDEHG